MDDLDKGAAGPAFEALMTLARLFVDPKALQAQMAAFAAGSTRIKEERTASELADRERAAALDAREAELARQEQELRDYHAKVLAKDGDADQKLDLARTLYQRIGGMEKQMVRALMRHADILSGFNEQLQSLPSLQEALRLLGPPQDAHFDDDSAIAVASETETVPSDHRVLGSNLTRERPLRTARRVQPSA
jgi:chromosome segregation ATPase